MIVIQYKANHGNGTQVDSVLYTDAEELTTSGVLRLR